MNMTASGAIESKNAEFWAELCGTATARSLGVHDSSPSSLRRFDEWYFDFYPYLEKHIPFAALSDKRVLEVGLGYGSVAQRLATHAASYDGLDISPGPVGMANHRLRQAGLPGQAHQGNILACPFADATFDYVVAIGCYHHTGDLGRAISETRRILKPGGSATIMVYNAYSYRRWLRWRRPTFSYFLWDKLGLGNIAAASEGERAAYDADSTGAAAPETVFVSASHFRRLASDWASVRIFRENIGTTRPLSHLDRKSLLRYLGPIMGLDLYCRMTK
jgi:SAM-dependent methyltransferase